MRGVVKFFGYVVATMAGLAVVSVVVLQLVSDETYKAWITTAVTSATGRTLAIDGDFNLDLGTITRIEATDLSFANAQWGSRPHMLQAGRIQGEVRLWPLFNGVLDIVLRTDDLEWVFETDASGRGNWEFGEPDPEDKTRTKTADDGIALRLVPRDIRATRSRLWFIRGDTGASRTAELANLQLGIIDGRIGAALEGRVDGRAVTLSAELESLEPGKNGAANARLDAQFGDIAITGTGTATELGNSAGPRLDLALEVKVPNTRALDPFSFVSLPELGAINVSARLRGNNGTYAVEDLLGQLSGDTTNAAIQGRIDHLTALDGIDLRADVRTDALPEIIGALGLDLPVKAPRFVDAHAVVRGNRTSLALHDGNLVARDEGVEAVLTGSVENLFKHDGVRTHIKLNAASLDALSKFVRRELPKTGALDATASVNTSGGRYQLIDLDLSLQGEAMEAQISGSIADVARLGGINLDLEGRIRSLADFSTMMERKFPETPSLTVSARFIADRGAQGPSSVVANIEGDWLTADVKARIGTLREFKDIDSDVSLTLDSLQRVGLLFGTSLPDVPAKASGHIRDANESYALTDFNARIEDEALNVQLRGSIADLLALKGINIELTGSTPSLSRLPNFGDAELPETGMLDLQATVQADKDIAAPAVLSARIKGETISGSVDGSLTNLETLDGLDLTLVIEAARLDHVGKLTGIKLPASGPVSARAKLVNDAGVISIDPLALSVGNSKVKGRLEYASKTEDRESKSKISGRLASEYIDLNEILDIGAAAKTGLESKAASETTAVAQESATATAHVERVFSDTPVPLRQLRRNDIDIALDTKRLRILHTDIDELSLAIKVHEGRSEVEVSKARLGDRPIEAELMLDAGTEPARFAVKIDADQIPLPPTSQLDAVLQGGELLLKVDVAGQGASMREIMAHLNGQAIIALRDSRTPNNLLNRFGSGISVSRINPFDDNEQYTTLQCGASRFEINDGVAKTPRGLAVQLPKVTWLGSGQLNLKTEEIDIRLQPHARRTVLSAGSLATMLQLRGSLANPQLVVDPVGLAKTGGNVALAFSTGGASLLVEGLRGFFRANVDRCQRIQEEILNEPSKKKTGSE